MSKVFTAVKYFKADYNGAGVLAMTELLGDLMQAFDAVPLVGSLISTLAKGFLDFFFNPSTRSILTEALDRQYIRELKHEGAGEGLYLDFVFSRLEYIERVLYKVSALKSSLQSTHYQCQ